MAVVMQFLLGDYRYASERADNNNLRFQSYGIKL